MKPAVKLGRWQEPPRMEPGSPQPRTRQSGDTLYLAYVCHNPEFQGWADNAPDHVGFDVYSAVLRFDHVAWHRLGPPSNERLYMHPFYSSGLKSYDFWEVFGSNELAKFPGKRHWIITFHDQTFEVAADFAAVHASRVEGEDTHTIVARA